MFPLLLCHYFFLNIGDKMDTLGLICTVSDDLLCFLWSFLMEAVSFLMEAREFLHVVVDGEGGVRFMLFSHHYQYYWAYT